MSLLDFIFPRICHICGTRLSDKEKYICTSCISRLPRTRFHRMPMNPMEQRFAGRFPFEKATAHFFYSGDTDIATIIHDLKYHRFRGLAQHLGAIVATELMSTGFFSDIDAIIPIPMYRLKKATRGYNQTEEIAEGIREITRLPILTNLQAVRNHHTQTRLTLERRLHNLSNTMRVIDAAQLTGKHLLLLDDVCTTGATLTTAADTLYQAHGITNPSAPTSAPLPFRLSILTLAATI